MAINREILKLAVPSILANITVPLVGMVDIAVAGHLDADAATLIGGIAIGSMLFDMLYWSFGFLRVGTGGLAAQAFGSGDRKECARILTRALAMSLAIALFLIAIQWIFVKAAFLVVDCTPEVRVLASRYFFIRIWAAPATLSLMALKGWFIGMQDSISAMVADLTVNGMNIGLSLLLALGLSVGGTVIVPAMGFDGVAVGTLAAQWIGLITVAFILAFKYRKNTLGLLDLQDIKTLFNGTETRRFFHMNTDLFIRSACMIAIYIGFTVISARYGDVLLAVSSILMKLLLLFSYFTDGFAYAGEALTGKYIGAKNPMMLRQTIKWTFIWSMSIASLFILIYYFAGVPMLKVMTSDMAVIEAAKDYLPWLLLMPIVGCAAFTWDGIYIGATASKGMRDSTLWAVAVFTSVWGLGMLLLNAFVGKGSADYDVLALHVLMAAYFAHLVARTVYLTCNRRKCVA
jgi:MATE family multidrug resistance protein